MYDTKTSLHNNEVMKISNIEEGLKMVTDGQAMKQVNMFKYLGTCIANDGIGLIRKPHVMQIKEQTLKWSKVHSRKENI